jgi:penicillin-binding protein 1A
MNKRNIYTNNHKVKRKSYKLISKTLKVSFLKGTKILASAAILLATFLLLLTLFYSLDLPDVAMFFEVNKKRNITLVNRNNEIIASFGEIHSDYIIYEDVPKHLVDALIATEDRRFFSHHGIDLIGLARAFYRNYIVRGSIQGGSTITQQLAKIAFLSPERTFKRKIQELLLSFYLENRFTKEQILTAYLNRVYMGSGVFGMEAAAKFYFDKHVKKLNLLESAILVGMLKAPSRYSPLHNSELSGKRAYQILLNMEEAGFINKDDVENTLAQSVILQTNKGLRRSTYFAGYVVDQINYLFPDTGVDLIVQVTVNESLQEYCQALLRKYIDKVGKEKNISQGAIIVLNNIGEIITMIGGGDYVKSPYNRAVQAKRQPGSAFKHIVYANAFNHGMTPETLIEDKPIKMGSWQPQNNTKRFYGEVSLNEAFARSLNTISITLTSNFGINSVKELAQAMGINSSLPDNLTIALGTGEISVLELATSYSVITNDGVLIEPFSITEVRDVEQNILFKRTNNQPIQVLDQKTNSYMHLLLKSTVNQGSGKKALIDNVDMGGKTGTSQDFRDAWFIGYVNHYTIAIWLGNDDNSPMKEVGGSSYPAQIFRDIALHLK